MCCAEFMRARVPAVTEDEELDSWPDNKPDPAAITDLQLGWVCASLLRHVDQYVLLLSNSVERGAESNNPFVEGAQEEAEEWLGHIEDFALAVKPPCSFSYLLDCFETADLEL